MQPTDPISPVKHDANAPQWIWPRAAYVHVPFCAHHCNYCDFAVVAGQDQRIELYLEALAAELATLSQPQPVATIFLGGGTPSYLNLRQLETLLTILRRWFPEQPGQEFSLEANPSSLDAGKLAILARHGVNRLSLGVQSFQPHLLHTLERDHTPDDVRRVAELVHERGFRLSLDLIFAVP